MYKKYSSIKDEFRGLIDHIFERGNISQNVRAWFKNETDNSSYGNLSRIFDELDGMQDALEDSQPGSIEEIKAVLADRKALAEEKEFWGINDFRFYQDPDNSEVLVLTNDEAEYMDRYPRHFNEILGVEGIKKLTHSEFNFYLVYTQKRYTNLEDLKHDYFALKLAKLEE